MFLIETNSNVSCVERCKFMSNKTWANKSAIILNQLTLSLAHSHASKRHFNVGQENYFSGSGQLSQFDQTMGPIGNFKFTKQLNCASCLIINLLTLGFVSRPSWKAKKKFRKDRFASIFQEEYENDFFFGVTMRWIKISETMKWMRTFAKC